MKRIIMVLAVAALFGASAAQADTTTSNSVAGAAAQQGLVNNPVTIFNDAPIPTTTTVKNTPGFAMSGPASGPCNGASGGLTLVGPGFGGGVNASVESANCNGRETSRVASSNAMVANQLGNKAMTDKFLSMAAEALEATPYWQDVVKAKQEKQAAMSQPATVAQRPTQQQVATAKAQCSPFSQAPCVE